MKCKCHGVSGSCSIRTCWKGLQDLREIAIDLKAKYLSATKVVHRPMGTRKQLVPKDIDIRPVRENELVYLQSSPDFCARNEKQGSVGTQDRWDSHVIWLWTACILSTRQDFKVWSPLAKMTMETTGSEINMQGCHVGDCQSWVSTHPGCGLLWCSCLTCLVDSTNWLAGW